MSRRLLPGMLPCFGFAQSSRLDGIDGVYAIIGSFVIKVPA